MSMCIVEAKVRKGSPIIGMTIEEVEKKYDVKILSVNGIER